MYTREEIKESNKLHEVEGDDHRTCAIISRQLITQLEATEAKLAESVEILAFYADKDSWQVPYDDSGKGVEAFEDEGLMAREFLEKYRSGLLDELTRESQEAGLYDDRKDGE